MHKDSTLQLITNGIQCHQSNDLEGAEQIYNTIISQFPDHVDALYLLGTLKAQQSSYTDAEKLLTKVIAVNPRHSGAFLSLGNVALEQKEYGKAEHFYKCALKLAPLFFEAEFSLGKAYLASGHYANARSSFERALNLKPDYLPAMINIGTSLRHLGKYKEAILSYRKILQCQPEMVEIYAELGEALLGLGRKEEAASAYCTLIKARPDSFMAHNNLGKVYQKLSQYDDAEHCYLRAIKIKPDLVQAHNNLGNIYKVKGLHQKAVSCYRRAVELDPEFWQAHSNLLLCLNYIPGITQKQLFEEHLLWGNMHAPKSSPRQYHSNNHDRERVLRIGYVSPDFRSHAVAAFFEPLISNHNPANVEAICYAEVSNPDATSNRLRTQAGGWVNTVGMRDDEVVQRIIDDRIDILVDLAGHTANNRLTIFGYRPAPVQASYLGYPNTTGVWSIDYRLTDAITDPGDLDSFYTEELVRLEDGLTCFMPQEYTPSPGNLPAIANKCITFGSLNNLAKMNAQVIELWSQVLHAVPGSRLMLFRDMLQGSIVDHYRKLFGRHGITPERLELCGNRVSMGAHLTVYNEIDIALDPMPWNGHVSSCEALWMGVPVITLYGNTCAGRLTASVLYQAGLDDLIAKTPEQYIRVASKLSGDLESLSKLRKMMRSRVLSSALCNGIRLACSVESAYRFMWHRWCAQQA